MHDSNLLERQQDAKPIRTGKLIQMAGAVRAVLCLISCIGTVFLSIAHKAYRYATWMSWIPGWTGELD